jgi:type VI secretion system secreted protein Hcp
LDAATPKINFLCTSGKHVPSATLELCRATGDKQLYMQYKMTDVTVKKYEGGGDSKGDDALPEYEGELRFEKMELVYTKTDHKTGKPVGDVKSHWDTASNTGG